MRGRHPPLHKEGFGSAGGRGRPPAEYISCCPIKGLFFFRKSVILCICEQMFAYSAGKENEKMCVKEWKRIAEREAMRYREHKAFIKGVEDANGVVPERYGQSLRWVLAADLVLGRLKAHDPEKERFFRAYFGTDGKRVRSGKRGMVALSFDFCVSQSTLYRWRNELLTLLVIAAAQTGALLPYRSEEKEARR